MRTPMQLNGNLRESSDKYKYMDIGGYVNNKVHIAGHNIVKQRGTL